MKTAKGCLNFVLGVLVGVILIVGSIVGAGVWLYKGATLKHLENVTKNEINLNNESGIKNKSIETILKELKIILGEPDTLSISKIENYFGVKNLLPSSIMGMSLASIKNAPLNDIGKGFQAFFDEITLEIVESAEGLNLQLPDVPLIKFLKETNASLKNAFEEIARCLDPEILKVSDLETKFGIEISENQLLKSLAEKDTLVSNIASTVNDLKFSEIFAPDQLGSLSNAIKDEKIADFGLAIKKITIGDFFPAPETGEDTRSVFIKSISAKTINEIANDGFVNNLKVSEIMEINETSSPILIDLKDCKVTEIASSILQIKIASIYPDDTGIIGAIVAEDNAYNVGKAEADKVYTTVNGLQPKITAKIQSATLYDLFDWNYLIGIERSQLDFTIGGKKLGTFNLSGFVVAVLDFAATP